LTRSGLPSEPPWRLPAWLSLTLVTAVAARVGAAVWAATNNTHGDYYASLPGPYVRHLNPVLWDSPDLHGAWGFHAETYFHGPTQYLTLYPVALLDSYAAIASVLLPVFVIVLGVTFWIMLRTLARLAPGQRLLVPLLASTFLFFPLLQSLIQREFEVVILLGLAWALRLMIQDRRRAAAALLAYVTWFKYIPLLFAGHLMLRRWYAAAATFAAASAVILGVAHGLFGLPLFFNNNVPGHAWQVAAVTSAGFRVDEGGHLIGLGFCQGWFDNETTLANVRHGLCTIAAHAPWFPPNVVYVLICGAIAAVYLRTHARLERRNIDSMTEGWRRALEMSIVTTVCGCFFFSHYYYLILLVLPLNVLLARFIAMRQRSALALWAISYFLIAAFVVPTGLVSRLAGVDVWEEYIWGAWFLPGQLLLMWLLLREYRSLAA